MKHATTNIHPIMQAALSLGPEFTEWDWSIATWKLASDRFSMKGYPHPDHKRFYMDITGDKPANPIFREWVERIRPNTYRLTPLGRAIAFSLIERETMTEFYTVSSRLSTHKVFRTWRERPEYPSEFHAVRDFLLAPADRVISHFGFCRQQIEAAMGWCRIHGLSCLARRAHHNEGMDPPPILYTDLAELLDFFTCLEARFPELKRKPARQAK